MLADKATSALHAENYQKGTSPAVGQISVTNNKPTDRLTLYLHGICPCAVSVPAEKFLQY